MTPLPDLINHTISKGLSFIKSNQKKDGGFKSLSCFESSDFKDAKVYDSVFSTSLILACLSDITGYSLSEKVKSGAAKFLINQKSQFWSFNYWVRGSRESKTKPYPDDLDDTFAALSALHLYNQKLLDGRALAKIINILTALESKEGGPYYTWLVPPDSKRIWKDIDIAVNSNIAFFLKLQEIALPNLTKFIEQKIDKKYFSSPYYPDSFPVIYFITRFYEGPKKIKLIKYLLQKRPKNPLTLALTTSSLINLGYRGKYLRNAIIKILKSINGKRGWDAYAFCMDPSLDKKTYFSGSQTLTTAFCIEALYKYSAISKKEYRPKKQNLLYKDTISEIKFRFSKLPNELKIICYENLDNLIKGDTSGKKILIAYYFLESCSSKSRSRISKKIVMKLAMANTYGWMAYTIYDNFLDNEGDSKLLSAANLYLRELTDIFINLLPETKFKLLFNEIMDKLESANTWEATTCRFNPKYTLRPPSSFYRWKNLSKLADKSFGHALGPMAILYALGFNEKSPEVKNLSNFFKHFLIAKQLNDDAHDWNVDFSRGHLTPVVSMILNKANIKNDIPKKKLLNYLQEIFLTRVIDNVCNKILAHTKLARMSLKKISIIENFEILESFLLPAEGSAKKALNEKKNALLFIKTYKN